MDKAVKFSWPIFITQLCIVAAMLITGLVLWDKLPEMIPSHWNIQGEIDSYMQKSTWIFLFPGITLLITLLFPVLSRIDPKKAKYVLFRKAWLIIQMILVGFFAYLYFISLYLTFHPEVSITPFVFAGIGVMFILMGNYLGKVRQNWFLGIRTPWTLENEEVWNKTNRLAGWLFALCGIAIFTDAFLMWSNTWSIWVSVVLVVIVPVLYSYILFQRLKK